MEIEKRREVNLKKYFIIFFITASIFLTAFYFSNILNEKRLVNVSDVEDSMETNILSSEMQFALLKDVSCKGINEKTILSNELKDLAKKISFMEKSLGNKNSEVLKLRKKYSLLEIKDILLMKEIKKKCNLKPINILYFYSNKDEKCSDCKKQGYVLTRLSQDNPRLRVYSFDYDLDLGALKTLKNIKKVDNKKLPILVLNDKVYSGFQSLEKIKKLLPKLEIIEKRYLKNFGDSDSKVEIQCAEDKQCKIENNIFNVCGRPIAINIKNNAKDIEEFSKVEKDLTKLVDIKCALLSDYKDEAFCSKENTCEVREK